MTDNSWINDFMDAVVQAEQTEHEVTELSESAARGLLAWCLQPLDGGVAGADGTAGGGAGFTVSVRPLRHQVPASAAELGLRWLVPGLPVCLRPLQARAQRHFRDASFARPPC